MILITVLNFRRATTELEDIRVFPFLPKHELVAIIWSKRSILNEFKRYMVMLTKNSRMIDEKVEEHAT